VRGKRPRLALGYRKKKKRGREDKKNHGAEKITNGGERGERRLSQSGSVPERREKTREGLWFNGSKKDNLLKEHTGRSFTNLKKEAGQVTKEPSGGIHRVPS